MTTGVAGVGGGVSVGFVVFDAWLLIHIEPPTQAIAIGT
jgi:hypothetical protein